MLNLNIIRLVYDLTILFGAFARGGSFQANRGRHREQYEDQSGVSQGVFLELPFRKSLLLNLLKTNILIS